MQRLPPPPPSFRGTFSTDDESLRRAASELHPEKALYRLCDGAIGREFTGCEQVNYNRLEQLRQDEERRR